MMMFFVKRILHEQKLQKDQQRKQFQPYMIPYLLDAYGLKPTGHVCMMCFI
jgi:hypothetical protein